MGHTIESVSMIYATHNALQQRKKEYLSDICGPITNLNFS